MEMVCSHEFLFSNADLGQKCDITQDCDQQYINYFEISYCWMQGNWIIIMLISLVVLALNFRIIQLLVGEYLAPALEVLTDKLKISESLAAVTLLAFANGAGDVISALAVPENDETIKYNIGALYGAGFFATTIVVGLIIIYAKNEVQLMKYSLSRDLIFYICVTIYVIVCGIRDQFTFYDSIIIISIYIVYVLVVYIQDRYSHNQPQVHNALNASEYSESQEQLINEETDQQIQAHVHLNPHYELDCHTKYFDKPVKFILSLTIPPPKYDNNLYKLTIFPGLLISALIIFQDFYWFNWVVYYIPISLVVSLFLYFYDIDSGVICLFTAFIAIIQTFLLSGMIIDILNFIGLLSNLSTDYLGLTVIALGNVITDSIVTVTLSQQGYSIMAMTGIYAGQLFALLIGLGCSILKQTLDFIPIQFELRSSLIMEILIGAVLSTLIFTFLFAILKKFKFKGKISFVYISIYIIVFAALTTIAIIQAVQQS